MPIINDPSSRYKPAPKPERSMLGSAYQIFAVVAVLVGIWAIGYGLLSDQIKISIAGGGSLLAAFLLFGLGQFFDQIARIASATEETARLLRERPSA